MTSRKLALLLPLTLHLLTSVHLAAATFTVGAGDVTGLKSALNTSNTNNQDDTINLSAGTYSLTAQDNAGNGLPIILTDSGHHLTINGNGATIQNNAPSGGFRFFQLGSGDIVTISNVTFVNGTSTQGGAIYKDGTSNLTLIGCTFTGNNIEPTANAGQSGGAICNFAGMLAVQNCTFSGNSIHIIMGGTPGGAAIYNNLGGTTSVSGSLFSGNYITENSLGIAGGGAICNDGDGNPSNPPSDGTMTVTTSTFINNMAEGDGGAVINYGQMTVTASMFEGNSTENFAASGSGGAISNDNGTLTVQNCSFDGNQAMNSNGGGGAIESQGYNHGVATRNASLNVFSCTFSTNTGTNGSAIDIESDTSTNSFSQLANNIFANGSSGNNNLHTTCLTTRGVSAFINSQGYNLSDDSGGGFLTTAVDLTNTNPQLDPAGLQNNGGPTLTIALTTNSPAIDKGKSYGLTTDQRGFTRPVDRAGYTNASGGDGSDIGAYEANDTLQTGSALVVTKSDDHDDGTCGSDCTLREAINRANGDAASSEGGSHTISFAGNVTGTMILAGELDVTSDMTITGPGARNLALNGNSSSRIFAFTAGTSSISGLTIQNGRVAASTGNSAQGGGLYVTSLALTVTDCAFLGNQVLGGGAPAVSSQTGAVAQGGAVYVYGTSLSLINCTFATNSATGGPGTAGFGLFNGTAGGAGQGGAIYIANGFTYLSNCTLYNNLTGGGQGGFGHSSGGAGGAANGGAIANSGFLILVSSTVTANNGIGGTGGNNSSGGAASSGVSSGGVNNLNTAGVNAATVKGSIIAGNARNTSGGIDVDGPFSSGGYNLLGTGDQSTGFTGTGDMKGTDAALLNAGLVTPPVNNGGNTDTIGLSANSLAINASSSSVAPHRDQRGYLRTGRPDVGAFEYNAGLLNLVSVARNNTLGLVVSVEVAHGHVYRLERKLSLTDAQWQSIPGLTDYTATGNDTESLFDSDAISSLGHAFYEVFLVQ